MTGTETPGAAPDQAGAPGPEAAGGPEAHASGESRVSDLGEHLMHPHRGRAERGSRIGLVMGLLVIAAALALVVAFLLPSDASGATVAEDASALHGLPAESAAPGPRTGVLLDAEAEGVPFPRYAQAFGWGATGMRTDEVAGRTAVTMFYERRGHRIGYTVVSGAPVGAPRSAGRIVVAGTRVRTLRVDDRTVVMWQRLGHTLVMSGVGVTRRDLARLAGWKGGGGVPF